ncbi:structural protein P5 [Pseudomonas protegens]|uniref:structural protein P5 n=1 Tax=Pseudomonas protegens TaxID=380021 RepID=UPI000369DC61|nr:structural protein P5 [Pseudomonas protegens]ROM36918.1 structural protein [Pseudomonas protegens]
MSTPRGVRNNNPGNIDYSPSNKWNGQLGLEEGVAKPRFARFDTPENGIRALGKLLQTYQRVYGLNTVSQIISRWAPSNENDTAAYVKSVERRIGSAPGEKIRLTAPEVLKGFVVAIIAHENGGNPYSDAVISEGVRRALA